MQEISKSNMRLYGAGRKKVVETRKISKKCYEKIKEGG